MAKPKCGLCEKNAAKRYCPSLDLLICPVCCGSNRLKAIDCQETCRYLDHELYQQRIREEKELSFLLATVPSSQADDIFKESDAANIGGAFESFFAVCYVKGKFHLTDKKVKDTLTLVYYMKQKNKSAEPDEFAKLTIDVYDRLIREGYDPEYIGKVMLRIIISINHMTGGAMGPCGYMNYLKNNMHPDSPYYNSPYPVAETQDGKILPILLDGDQLTD